jgi:hypothetical protein
MVLKSAFLQIAFTKKELSSAFRFESDFTVTLVNRHRVTTERERLSDQGLSSSSSSSSSFPSQGCSPNFLFLSLSLALSLSFFFSVKRYRLWSAVSRVSESDSLFSRWTFID